MEQMFPPGEAQFQAPTPGPPVANQYQRPAFTPPAPSNQYQMSTYMPPAAPNQYQMHTYMPPAASNQYQMSTFMPPAGPSAAGNLLFPLPPPSSDGWQPGSGLPPNVLNMTTSAPANSPFSGPFPGPSAAFPSGQQGPQSGSAGRACKYCRQNFTGRAGAHLKHCGNAMQCRNCKDFCAKGGIQQHLAGHCKAAQQSQGPPPS
jgi:hypothetical protein